MRSAEAGAQLFLEFVTGAREEAEAAAVQSAQQTQQAQQVKQWRGLRQHQCGVGGGAAAAVVQPQQQGGGAGAGAAQSGGAAAQPLPPQYWNSAQHALAENRHYNAGIYHAWARRWHSWNR